MTPGIEELNRGGMINFDEIEVWKRPRKRTPEEIKDEAPIKKATKKKTFVRTNYEMRKLGPGEYVIKNPVYDKKGNLIGGVPITKNITNYRNCKVGNEHTLCINLQPGNNYNQADLIRVFELAVMQALEEPEVEPADQLKEKTRDVYVDDIKSMEDDEFSYDEDFVFDEKSYREFLPSYGEQSCIADCPDDAISLDEDVFCDDELFYQEEAAYEEDSFLLGFDNKECEQSSFMESSN